jgi:hypothetical protein
VQSTGLRRGDYTVFRPAFKPNASPDSEKDR